jgi:hypothetical protein
MIGVDSLKSVLVINIIRLWYLEYPHMPIRKTPMAGSIIQAQAYLQEFTSQGNHHANPGPNQSYSSTVQCL